MTTIPIRKRPIIVCDHGCGKSSLLAKYCRGTFPQPDVKTVFENYIVDLEIDGQQVELPFWDSGGQEEYEHLRFRDYPGSDVVLLSFAIDDPKSLENVLNKWITEVKHYCPNIPIILVGCKKDLRDDHSTIEKLKANGQHPTTPEEGMAVAQTIGAKHYVECSAKTGEGVRDVFQLGIEAALLSSHRKKKCCMIL